ncbi:hypothetical protein [Alkalicoccus daliensis]|uniref:Uncharacterized protein n=1 Tax=Alkalicoccus daliensis TaxID=745820 RepID=A0A1H0CUZ0_9BACI|nr:hypothetical protein [Alkalicoccus daliensis]SDN61710.1 hypothetical protein SAMN04488053_102241 [Alkalicoccus daliensis]
MTQEKLTSLRRKQLLLQTFLLLLAAGALYVIHLASGQSFQAVQISIAAIGIGIGIYKLIRKRSTWAPVSILQEVHVYEKEKLGAEWRKNDKSSAFYFIGFGIIYMGLSIWQGPQPMTLPPGFLLIVLILAASILVFFNWLSFREVDKAEGPEDFIQNRSKYAENKIAFQVTAVIGIYFTAMFLGIALYSQ